MDDESARLGDAFGVGPHLRAVLDSLGEGVVVQDGAGRVLFLNRSAEAMLGVAVGEAEGRTIREIGWSPLDESGDPIAVEDRPGFANGRPGEGVVLQHDHPEGGRRWVEVSSFPLVASDLPDAAVTVLRDITEGRLEAQVLRMQGLVLDSVGQAVMVVGLDQRILHWNRAAEEMYGWPAGEVLGRDVVEVTTFEDQAAHAEEVGAAAARGESWTGDFWARRRDGTRFPVLVTDTPIFDDRGELVAVVGIATDISARVAAENAREADRRRLEEAQRIGGLGSFELVLATGELVWSEGLYRLLGVDLQETPTIDLYRSLVHPDDAEAVGRAIARAVGEGLATEIEHRVVRRDGTVVWVRSQGSPVDDGDRLAGVVLDITARREAEMALAHAAMHDPLTGLPNRAFLEARLVEAARSAAEADSVVAVLAIGVDHFSVVNEELGHDAGDDLLVQIARRLLESAGPGDTTARLAADEFVVVRHGVYRSWGPARLARNVERSLAEPFVVQGREVFVTVSIGAVEIDTRSESTDALRLATDAMMRAKARGRAQTVVAASTSVGHQPTQRLDTASALRNASARDELRVHYQPVIDFESLRVSGFEALVRWQHPGRGLLFPGAFIDVAEDTGLILQIGRWVLGEAIQQIAQWRTEGPEPGLSIAVNVSARQLRTADLLVDLCEHLDRHDVPADAVHLEITESVLMDDVEHSIESLVALKSIGVRVDVDDFGTGYSSLSYLKRFPIDGLKIDQSFVQGLGTDTNDTAIAGAIASLAQALNLDVIAEGVETEMQAQQLEALGCHSGQGYLWSPAVVPSEARELVTGRPVGLAPITRGRRVASSPD